MTIKTHLDEAAFRKEISRWEREGKTPYYPTFICHENELIGGIDGNRFWLKKVRPQLVTGSQRVFFGKIIRTDNGMVVKGRFQHDLMTHLIMGILSLVWLGLTFIMTCRQPMSSDVLLKVFVISVLMYLAVIGLSNLSNFLFYFKEEKYVIKYLKSL